MGCQKEVAKSIVDRKGEYCLAVKDNQEILAENIASSFEDVLGDDTQGHAYEEVEVVEPRRSHGRYEKRVYYSMPAPKTLRTADQWAGLKSIGLTVTFRGESEQSPGSSEVRYYIMRFANDVNRFAEAVRGHWGIETSLHWVMGVTFREDEFRIHKDHGGRTSAGSVAWRSRR